VRAPARRGSVVIEPRPSCVRSALSLPSIFFSLCSRARLCCDRCETRWGFERRPRINYPMLFTGNARCDDRCEPALRATRDEDATGDGSSRIVYRVSNGLSVRVSGYGSSFSSGEPEVDCGLIRSSSGSAVLQSVCRVRFLPRIHGRHLAPSTRPSGLLRVHRRRRVRSAHLAGSMIATLFSQNRWAALI